MSQYQGNQIKGNREDRNTNTILKNLAIKNNIDYIINQHKSIVIEFDLRDLDEIVNKAKESSNLVVNNEINKKNLDELRNIFSSQGYPLF